MFKAVACLLVFLQLVPLGAAQSKVLLEANPQDLPALAVDHELIIQSTVENRPVYTAIAPAGKFSTTLSNMMADPKVIAVEPDQDADVTEKHALNLATGLPDALVDAASNRTMLSYYGANVRAVYVQQPASILIRLAEAQRLSTGGTVVAIIDTGVDPGHPALAGALVPGYDFTRETEYVNELMDLDPLAAATLTQSTVAFLDTYAARVNQSTVAFLDRFAAEVFNKQALPSAFGHGTMVAGIVHLVAPSAKIMPLKAFRADGTSTLSDIVRAIYYAVDHGASVINMSFSIPTPSRELSKALEYAASRRVICIASAGNMGANVKLYPAGNDSVIGVGSTNVLDVRSMFSNYDVSSARIAAPGEALITTFPGNHYAGVWGTSFSAALVTGAVDLMRQAQPSASSSAIEDALDHGEKIEQKMGGTRFGPGPLPAVFEQELKEPHS